MFILNVAELRHIHIYLIAELRHIYFFKAMYKICDIL
jgi:hypothetical protein